MNLLVLGTLSGMAIIACRQTPAPGSGRDRPIATADVAIELHSYFRDLRVVHARVGGDTLTLLLDTGGGATLITPQVARDLGCTPHGSDVGHRMTGEPVDFASCDSLLIAVGAWSARFAPVAVFDVAALLPKELPQLDCDLALYALRRQVLTVDWPAGSLVVRGSLTATAALANTCVSLRLATC